MKNTIFSPADILLPPDGFEKWSVIACDQFTSQPEYWKAAADFAGSAPSALGLVMPEAWLGQTDELEAAGRISVRMSELLASGTLRKLERSYVYVEREMQSGLLRRGIVGAADLECYDYAPGTQKPIRATEETVEARLPVRVAVRAGASLELPHIMLMMADNDRRAFRLAEAMKNRLEKLYDFDLMLGGGHITGWRICGEDAEALEECFTADGGAKLIIGDGNHSLAAARKHWLSVKASLSPEEAEHHPARYCLAEVCGVWDEAIEFHPIHRVLFHADAEKLHERLRAALPDGEGLRVELVTGSGNTVFNTRFKDAGSATEAVQRVLDGFVTETGAKIDYVHGEAEAAGLGAEKDCAAVIMPPMERGELFKAANAGRIFPRKCFSIGSAKEKRYYLEARKIVL